MSTRSSAASSLLPPPSGGSMMRPLGAKPSSPLFSAGGVSLPKLPPVGGSGVKPAALPSLPPLGGAKPGLPSLTVAPSATKPLPSLTPKKAPGPITPPAAVEPAPVEEKIMVPSVTEEIRVAAPQVNIDVSGITDGLAKITAQLEVAPTATLFQMEMMELTKEMKSLGRVADHLEAIATGDKVAKMVESFEQLMVNLTAALDRQNTIATYMAQLLATVIPAPEVADVVVENSPGGGEEGSVPAAEEEAAAPVVEEEVFA